jgi:hypothetical protein
LLRFHLPLICVVVVVVVIVVDVVEARSVLIVLRAAKVNLRSIHTQLAFCRKKMKKFDENVVLAKKSEMRKIQKSLELSFEQTNCIILLHTLFPKETQTQTPIYLFCRSL